MNFIKWLVGQLFGSKPAAEFEAKYGAEISSLEQEYIASNPEATESAVAAYVLGKTEPYIKEITSPFPSWAQALLAAGIVSAETSLIDKAYEAFVAEPKAA